MTEIPYSATRREKEASSARPLELALLDPQISGELRIVGSDLIVAGGRPSAASFQGVQRIGGRRGKQGAGLRAHRKQSRKRPGSASLDR